MTLKQLIREYVNDHFDHFGFYPYEVEVDGFTTRTDYYQNFEISFDEFWEDYCKEMDFDEEESDLNDWDNEDLMQVAWEYILL